MSTAAKKDKKFRGIFNRYQKSKGLGKYILEDIRSLFTIIWLFIRNGFQHRVLIVYPHYPSKRSTVYRIAKELGYFLTNKLSAKATLAVYWEYQTFRSEFAELESFCDKRSIPVINRQSRDISKFFVDQAFSKVFGYSTRVDPLKHVGPCVAKSDINAKHDGRVLQGPLKQAESDTIYQILIDNRAGPDLVKDLRVPIYGSTIPFVFIKYRSIGERFKNTTVRTEMFAAREIFSEAEIAGILAFTASIQLDHGELDILRDEGSGKIYIVDVNNTPQSPPANCSRELEKTAVKAMSAAFASQFLKK